MSASPRQRINRVMKFYYDRGSNKESVNKVYYNLLKIIYHEKVQSKET